MLSGVKFQNLISVATGPAAAETPSDEPPRDATSMPYVPSLSAHLPTSLSAHLPTKPGEDSGVDHAVGIESAMPATGHWFPVHAPQRALPVHHVTGTREVGNDSAMARYAAGDDTAFAELYDGLAPLLMAYLRRRTRDRNLVEDLVQETFLRLHLHRGRYKLDAPVLPWALTIAARLLANRVRGIRRANVVFSDDDQARDEGVEATSPEQWVIGMELAERIEQELLRLPSADREAFDLVKREGLPLKIAAPRLRMTTLALKMRIFRVCGRLRRLMSGGSNASNA